MKPPLRPFDYMRWAQTVPRGARFDLTASGVSDAAPDVVDDAWSSTASITPECVRSEWEPLHDDLTIAIAQRYDVDPSCVTLTVGASLAITHVMMALVRAGDHVVVERPTYEALHRVPEIFGATVSRLERKFEEGWAVVPDRLAKLLTPRTRAVVLTNLHNPSGTTIDPETLTAVSDLAARVGASVLVDEVYLDYDFGSESPLCRPACLVAQNAVSWASSTKCFGFSALRVGWIVTRHPETARAVRLAADYLHVQLPPLSARLGRVVVDRAPTLASRARMIAATGRQVLTEWLEHERRITWVPPGPGLCAALRLPTFLQDNAFCEHLRARYDTQVVPGSFFEAPGFVRIGFGVAPDHLRHGLSHFSSALDDLT